MTVAFNSSGSRMVVLGFASFAIASVLSACGASKNAIPKVSTPTSVLSCSSASNPVVIDWSPNRESAVNRTGGGYRLYVGASSGFNVAQALQTVNVPYVNGALAPTTATLSTLAKGRYYVKVSAYSNLGGSNQSANSSEICIDVKQ